MAPPNDPRRPYKRQAISDQQRRREIALQAQSTRRADAQARARALASSLITTQAPPADDHRHKDAEEDGEEVEHTVADVAAAASKLRGSDARRWFARQIMLPEWMVDAPPHLARDWSVTPSLSNYPSKCNLIYLKHYCFSCSRLIFSLSTLPCCVQSFEHLTIRVHLS
jgi:snurportin-1